MSATSLTKRANVMPNKAIQLKNFLLCSTFFLLSVGGKKRILTQARDKISLLRQNGDANKKRCRTMKANGDKTGTLPSAKDRKLL